MKSAFVGRHEARIVQIDFSTAFDKVNQQGIIYQLCSVGIRDYVMSILTLFISNLSQNAIMDGRWSESVNFMSGVPQWIVFGLLLFLLLTSEHFAILENS